ncbi:hypothetical protein L1887_15573 [Cichorium endivia]|nr:hypothetical protein L1887_15573 [Cichorium endivia]
MEATEYPNTEAVGVTGMDLIVSEDVCELQPMNVETVDVQHGSLVAKTWIPEVELKPYVGDFEVLFMKSDCTISCSCLRFELTGCLCRHCFYVLRMSGVEHFPSKYISRRWTKDVVPRSSRGYEMRPFPTNDGQEDLKTMIRDIYLSVDYCVDKLVTNLETLNLYREKQREMMKEVDNDTRYLQPMTNRSFIKSIIGVEKRKEVIVKIPDGIRNKGSGPIKTRLIGEKEKAILKAKKGTRKCGRCGKYVDHNAHTCQEETSLFYDK